MSLKRCALIKDGIVQGVIIIDADFVLIIDDLNQAAKGDLFDYETQVFTKAEEE